MQSIKIGMSHFLLYQATETNKTNPLLEDMINRDTQILSITTTITAVSEVINL